MLEEKIIIMSPEESKKMHFDIERGKCFPPSWTGGGLTSRYNPLDFERTHCAYAPKGYDCGKARVGPLGGKSHAPTCSECGYHPSNKLMR